MQSFDADGIPLRSVVLRAVQPRKLSCYHRLQAVSLPRTLSLSIQFLSCLWIVKPLSPPLSYSSITTMFLFTLQAVAFLSCLTCGLAQTSTSSSPFTVYTLTAENITAKFIPYGARLTSLLVPDRSGNVQDIVLGYDNATQYAIDTATNHTYFGPIVGRYANRIKNGTFTIDGNAYHVPENEHGGLDTLHGGKVGYDQRNWTVTAQSNDSITFSFLDVALQGFPRTVYTQATYTVSSVASGPYGENVSEIDVQDDIAGS